MKRKITLLLLAAGTMFSVRSQVLISEDFNVPFTPGTTLTTAPGFDWVVINNSSPAGVNSWAQGNQTGGNGTVTAYNGATNAFYMADFTSVGAPVGDISAFLITPTVTIYSGAELKFATRTMVFSGAALYPDRMQVLMSQNGNTTIATTTAAVGSFTNILLDINPNLTSSTSSVVSNGTVVNGYPQAWTVYTIPITNVTGTVTGRFAFRYFVSNGGSAGGNSRLVALDGVRFTLPCGPTIQSYTTCSGMTSTLTALNGVAVTSYSWNTGATTNTVSVNPTSTTVYSLYPSIGGSVSCGVVQTATVTVSGQLSVLVNASQSTVCAGTAVVLSSTSSAQQFAWTNGTATVGTAPTITINPTVTATYSLGALTGTFPTSFCAGGNTLVITVNPNPTVTIAGNTLVCTSGGTATASFTASGALGYNWFDDNGAFTGTSTSVSYAAPIETVTGLTNFSVYATGFDANGCSDTDVFSYTVGLKPIITGTISKTPVCINQTVTLDAEGADTYTWTGPVTGNSSGISFPTGTVVGNKTFTVTGTNSDGCTNSKAMTVNVNACAGIEKVDGDYSASLVFPNPFANQITISGLTGQVFVYNALGQVVIKVDMGGSDETIDTSSLPKGAYILTVQDKNGLNTKTIKLLKN